MRNGRGKSINVKIATSKVIKALESALVSKQEYKETYKVEQEKYQKALAKWEKDVAGLVKSGTKPNQIRVSQKSHWRETDGYEVTLSFDVPFEKVTQKPEQPEVIHDYQLKQEIEEIENAIRILKMTDEETVSTSTYNSIARYL
jgi:hypothetical protein